MKRFIVLLALLFAGPTLGQTLPKGSVAVGKGPGISGFTAVAPGAAGNPLVSNGVGVDPSFQAIALPSSVFANPTASLGLTAINGVATTAMRSDSAPALSQVITPSWTALHTWTIASGTGKATSINNSAPSGSSTGFVLNEVNCGLGTPDAINGGASPSNNCWRVSHRFGGATVEGGRQTQACQAVLTSATSATDGLPQWVCGSFLFLGNVNAGGTSLVALANTKGAGYAINPICILVSGATFYSECTGAEFNIDMQTGSSAWYAATATFAPGTSHAVRGSYYDANIALSSGSATGSAFGILFGPMNTYHPVGAGDTAIGAVIKDRSGSGTVPNTVATFIDFSLWGCTSFTLKFAAFIQDCSGNSSGATFIAEGTTAATSSTTGAIRSAGGISAVGAIWAGTYTAVTPTVVNSLPTCNGALEGARAYVTNNNTAVAFDGAVTTGGAIRVPVFCNGTAWKQG